jgi:hypothetical protein
MKCAYNTPSLRLRGKLVASTRSNDLSGFEGGHQVIEAGSVGFCL